MMRRYSREKRERLSLDPCYRLRELVRIAFGIDSLAKRPFGDGYCPGFAGSLDGGTMFFSRM